MKFVLSSTKETFLDDLEDEVKIRVYLPEGETETQDVATDTFVYVGCDYASAVLVNSEEALERFLQKLAQYPENFETYKEEYESESIQVLEANGCFLISFDWDHCNEDFLLYLKAETVLLGASGPDDGSLVDILPATQWMKDEGKGLADFIVEFTDWDDDFEIYSNACDFIERICDYQPIYYGGNLLADLTVALNKTYEMFKEMVEEEE